MRTLSLNELEEVSGSGFLSFILPVVIGFVTGGPVGAVIGAGTVIATTGVKNLEHLNKNGQIPTINEILNQ